MCVILVESLKDNVILPHIIVIVGHYWGLIVIDFCCCCWGCIGRIYLGVTVVVVKLSDE